MMRAARLTLALGALILPAALVAGCGGVPGNAVAEVDGTPIEKASFDHWMTVAARSGGQTNAVVGQPPNFERCVANKRATTKPAKGRPKPTDESLRTQCKREYEQLRNQVLQLLINMEWLEGEAEELGIKVSDSEVRKTFETQKKQSFPKDADYQKFLKDSGQTEADILQRVRLDTLATKIREHVVKGKDKVTDAQVRQYYERNKQQFAAPERRDLRIVLTRNRDRANQARDALREGQSFSSVARRYSIDEASKDQGGRLPAVQKGQQEKALDDAIFEADLNELVGPVKTQFGYYLFRVSKVTPASQQTLAQATPTVKQIVTQQNQTKALNDFVKSFQEKWRERTECREGYVTENCSNGPKPKPTPQAGQEGQGQAPPGQ